MTYETEPRMTNTIHVKTADKDYIGIAQKIGDCYVDYDDHLLVYNPSTGTAERIHDDDCHVAYRCEEFHGSTLP